MTVLIDWGTTNLRAWHVDDAGQILRRHTSNLGLTSASSFGFLKALDQTVAELDAPADTPALLSGMVGSKTGWLEVPYTHAPTNAETLAAHVAAVPERKQTWIVGGVCCGQDQARPEVIRGEETQVFGILKTHPEARLICLPGTHSKWIDVREGKLCNIQTHMTGELFALIVDHSMVATQIGARDFDAKAFDLGLELAKQPQAFTNKLFQLRTQYLFNRVHADHVHAMASGLLIGTEIAAMAQATTGPVHLCGSTYLSQRYGMAMDTFGLDTVETDAEQATVDGLWTLWNRISP